MSQQDSVHFFRIGDLVRAPDGTQGIVVEARALFAVIGWDDGRREEVEQFDSRVTVIRRATSP